MDLGLGVCYFFLVLAVLAIAEDLLITIFDLEFRDFLFLSIPNFKPTPIPPIHLNIILHNPTLPPPKILHSNKINS
jgi:hypothetical protein